TVYIYSICFYFSSRSQHTSSRRDWSSDVCSSDLILCLTVSIGLLVWEPTPSIRDFIALKDKFVARQIVKSKSTKPSFSQMHNLRSEERRVGKEGKTMCRQSHK